MLNKFVVVVVVVVAYPSQRRYVSELIESRLQIHSDDHEATRR